MADLRMLEAKGVSSAYGRAQVLFDLSLNAKQGEVVVLLGRNGAGKSTTLKTLIGLVRPLSGEIRFGGQRIENWEPYQIARLGLGYVPEDRRIFTDLSVMENLEVGRQRPRAGAPQWTLEKVFQLFPNLAGMREREGARMSGGEQQMLAIARGLMAKPKILLLDEPSLGLAPAIINELFEVLASLRDEGMTVLLVDQMAALALAIADRAYVIESGSIVTAGVPEEIRGNAALERAYLGAH